MTESASTPYEPPQVEEIEGEEPVATGPGNVVS